MKASRYKAFSIIIALLTAWLIIHVARGILEFHNNAALKTKEYKEATELAAGDFIAKRDRLALDYHYGNMEVDDNPGDLLTTSAEIGQTEISEGTKSTTEAVTSVLATGSQHEVTPENEPNDTPLGAIDESGNQADGSVTTSTIMADNVTDAMVNQTSTGT